MAQPPPPPPPQAEHNLDPNDVLSNILQGIFTDENQMKLGAELSIIGLLIQAGINIAIGAGAFIIFVLLRPNNARVYARRYKALKDSRRPPKIGKGLFDWVPVLWRTGEKYMIENVDLDSVFFLRFLKLGMTLMAIYCVLGMCIILPYNYQNGDNRNVTPNLKKFILLWITLYHINKKLQMFWLHVGAAYLFTGIFFVFVWREYKHYVRVKQDYFASPSYQRKLQSRTVMVTRVPADMQSDQKLMSFISNRSSAAVPTQASIARKLGQLPKLIDEHEKHVRKLEAVLYKYLAGDIKQKQRPQIKINGAMVDAIEYYTVEIERLENTINRMRHENTSFTPTSVGFVSYATPLMANDALRSMKNVSPALASLAPHPKDIIWSNAQLTRSVRVARLWTARLFSVVFCFIAFWPVAALTFIGDATNIKAMWPKTRQFFDNHEIITTIWQSTFSPLILALYYIAIPHVFRAISRYQGISTHTGVERSVLKKMYIFYFLSNIVVFTLVGLIVRAVLWKSSFKDVMSSLGHNFVKALNNKAQFWTSYISLRGLNAMLELAQMISLTIIFIKRYTKDLTPRELRDLTKAPDFDYSPVYSLYLWVFTITMFYSVYCPIALPFAFLNFVLAYWVYKYAILYVYQTRHDTAGQMWRSVINRMVVSMIIFQVYLIGCLKDRMSEFIDRPDEIRRAQPIVYALIPLPVITCIAGFAMNRWLGPKVDYMMHTPETESYNGQKAANADLNADESLGDRFLHPMFSQALTTPVVDKRVRHLLPKVYRGRTSVYLDPNAVAYNQDSLETKVSSGVFAAAGARGLTDTDVLETESVMDERDRRDFDGASTPIPTRLGNMGAGMSRRFSVDSSTTSGDYADMVGLNGKSPHRLSPSSSQADLLGNAQPTSTNTSSPDLHNSEFRNMPARSIAGELSTLNGGGSGNNGSGPNHRSPHDDTFDPIDLYGGDDGEKESAYRSSEKGMAMMLSQPAANAGPRPPMHGARPPYARPGPGMRPGMRPGPRPAPRPGMNMARPNGGPSPYAPMQRPQTRPPGPPGPQGYPVRGNGQHPRPMMRPQQPQDRYGPPPQNRPGMMNMRPMLRPQPRPNSGLPPSPYGPGSSPMRPGFRPGSRPPQPQPQPQQRLPPPQDRPRNVPQWD